MKKPVHKDRVLPDVCVYPQKYGRHIRQYADIAYNLIRFLGPCCYLLANTTGMILILVSFLFIGKNYTFMAIFTAGVVVLGMSRFYHGIMVRLAFWAYLVSGFLLFILFNYFLTSLPVVVYNPSAVSGIRFLTIPLEDFFYNFTMMSVYLAFLPLGKRQSRDPEEFPDTQRIVLYYGSSGFTDQRYSV